MNFLPLIHLGNHPYSLRFFPSHPELLVKSVITTIILGRLNYKNLLAFQNSQKKKFQAN
jgi:hypothetical protein